MDDPHLEVLVRAELAVFVLFERAFASAPGEDGPRAEPKRRGGNLAAPLERKETAAVSGERVPLGHGVGTESKGSGSNGSWPKGLPSRSELGSIGSGTRSKMR